MKVMAENSEKQPETMLSRHSLGFLWLLLFLSEALVMGSLSFFNIEASVWHGLLVDSLSASALVVGGLFMWLHFRLGKAYEQIGIVAVKVTAVVFAAESGLMILFHVLDLPLPFWQEALLDAFVFAIVATPIIYYWVLLPLDKGHVRHGTAIPLHTSLVFAFLICFSVLMLDVVLPLGVAVGTLYVALVLIGLWFPARGAIIGLAVAGIALTIVGYFLSGAGDVTWMILGNRGLSIVAIGLTAVLVAIHKKNTEKLERYRRQIEDKATQLEAALEQEKEYSALQRQFVSLVSHEFRTPLAIIDGTAQRLIRRKDKVDSDELVLRANNVRSAVTRMIGLIDTTLYASRLDAGKIEMDVTSCDIEELLRDVCERQAEISPSHHIRISVDDLPGETFVDRRLIDQVLANLLSNAVKYAPNDPLIEVKGWAENDRVCISITDHGLGIPADELPNLFQRYFRASTASGIGGTGLGLCISKEFLDMHGGDISVDSVLDQGTTFTVSFPIERQDRAA